MKKNKRTIVYSLFGASSHCGYSKMKRIYSIHHKDGLYICIYVCECVFVCIYVVRFSLRNERTKSRARFCHEKGYSHLYDDHQTSFKVNVLLMLIKFTMLEYLMLFTSSLLLRSCMYVYVFIFMYTFLLVILLYFLHSGASAL